MSTATLTRFYCSFCDTITNFFKGFVTESRFDPDWDSKGYKATKFIKRLRIA